MRIKVSMVPKGRLAEHVKLDRLSFVTRMFAPFAKVLESWRRNHLIEEEVLAFHQGRPVSPTATAASEGLAPGEAVTWELVLPGDADALEQKPEQKQQESFLVKLRVEFPERKDVEAVDFDVKCTVRMERMMQTWRQRQQLPPSAVVRFCADDVDLAPEDTPLSKGWSKDQAHKRVSSFRCGRSLW